MASNEKSQKNDVNWGMIIAGAAAVSGAVVLAPTLLPDMAEGVSDIGSWIAEKVTGEGAAAGTSSVMDALTSDTARNVAGATLLGGGAAYMVTQRGSKDKGDDFEELMAEESQGGFAAREDMKRMQAVMQARMSMASPEYMQQMAGNMGRA